MNSGNEKIPAGLRFIGRSLGDLLELKARCRRRLEYLEQNRDKISDYVFRKLHQEYASYLEAVDGEVALGLSEYEIRLSEIKLFSNQLKLLEKTYDEKIQELSLRHQLGEYDRAQYEKLFADLEERMKRFSRSLEKYHVQQRQLEDFLTRVREERLAVVSEPSLAGQPETEVPPLEEEPAGLPVADEVSEPLSGAEPPALTPELSEVGPPEPGETEVPAVFRKETATVPQSAPEAELLIREPLAAEPEAVGPAEAGEFAAVAEETAAAQESGEQVETQTPAEAAEEAAPPEKAIPETGKSVQEPPAAAAETIEPEETESVVGEEPLPVASVESENKLAGDNLPAIEEITGEPGLEEEEAAAEEDFAVSEVERQVESMVESASETVSEADGLPGLRQVEEEPVQTEAETVEVPPEEPQPAEGPAASGGFSLEDIFGQSAEARAPEAQSPSAELESQATVSPGEIDLAEAVLPGTGEPAPGVAAPEAASPAGDGSFDLDAIMSAAGTNLQSQPSSAALQQAPAAAQVKQETVQQEEIPVFGLAEADAELVAAAGEQPEPDVEIEQAAESAREAEAELLELGSAEAQEGREDEAEEEFQIERAASLEEGIELQLGADGEESEADKLLTVNQTLDAIKKKTVKCPNCGTMNYAIRWYCENCEATLTSL